MIKNNHYGDTDNYDGGQVRKEEGSYAFFMEAASIEYNMQQYCDLRSALVLLQFLVVLKIREELIEFN